MFRIEYLPVPAEFQRAAPSGAAPIRHDAAGAAIAAGAAEDAAKGSGGAEAFLILVGLLIAGAVVKGLSGEPAPGAPATSGRPMEGLGDVALDPEARLFDAIFLSSRRFYDAEDRELSQKVRASAGEGGFYALLEESNRRHGQEQQWLKNLERRELEADFADLVKETGLNGAKRSRRARRA